MSQIRIAVIGASHLDADHQNALQALTAQGLITAYSLDPTDEAASRKALTDAQAMNALDAVVLAGPQVQLPVWIEAALGSDLHAYSMHPTPASIEEMIEIRKAEQTARGKILQFGFTARHHESVATAIAKAETGDYGALLSIRGVCGLADHTGHSILAGPTAQMLDLMQVFAGPFQDVSAFGDLARPGTEKNLQAVLRTHSGVTASLHASNSQWRETFRLELGYERGYLWLEGLSSETYTFGQEVLVYARIGANGAQHEMVERFEDSDGPLAALSAFIARIKDPSWPATGTSQQAFDTLNALQRIQAADPIIPYSEERQAS